MGANFTLQDNFVGLN